MKIRSVAFVVASIGASLFILLGSVQPAPAAVFPSPGKAITFISPWPAGGSTDTGSRVLAAYMEKELGTSIMVVNKPGASGQVGLTQLAAAKPDGYTIGLHSLPVSIVVYLDPQRKATYNRKSFELIGNQVLDASVVGVRVDSPLKSVKDLVDAAKARPEQLKVGAGGLMSTGHLPGLMLEKVAGVKFAWVQFDGGAPAITALLGGHVDAAIDTGGGFAAHVRAGNVRLLGISTAEESKAYPGVQTFVAQGYNVNLGVARGIAAPAGTPKEVIDILAAAMKRAMDNEEMKKKMEELALPPYYMGPAQFSAYWADQEVRIAPLMELGKQK